MRIFVQRSLAIASSILPFMTAWGAESVESADSAAEEVFIIGPSLTAAACQPDEVMDSDFLDVSRKPATYKNKCVRVQALIAGRELYSGVQGYYLAGARIGTVPERTEHHRMGIYASSELMEHIGARGPHFATVTGMVGECADFYGDNAMVMGYCHYTDDGTYVIVASITNQSEDIARQTGEHARARFGTLRAPPVDWPHRSIVEGIARRWLQAIQRHDSANFALLHGLELDDIDGDDDQPGELFYEAFTTADSSFASFRNSKAIPPAALFVVAPPKSLIDELQAKPQDDDYETSVACFCRTASCAERWPISLSDAANAPQRPYICAQIDIEGTREGEPTYNVHTNIEWRLLKEP
jgi:hypothetical protein